MTDPREEIADYLRARGVRLHDDVIDGIAALFLRERERGYGCPNGEACESCPCAAEDDVCFPGERLRAELVRERERADRQAEELRVIADTSEPGLRRAIARQSGELSARIVEIDALRERAEAAETAIRADERERLSARVYENGWCPTCANATVECERCRGTGSLAPRVEGLLNFIRCPDCALRRRVLDHAEQEKTT